MKEFSVGVGPKLAGFTRGGTVDEDGNVEEEGIEFNLRAIPLGGYVMFPENYNATLGYEMEVLAGKKRAEIQTIVEETRESNGNGISNSARSNGLLSAITLGLADNRKGGKEERIAALQTMAVDMTNNQKKGGAGAPWWKNPFGGNKKSSPKNSMEKSIIINEDGTVSTPPIDYYDDVDLLQNRPPLQRALVLVGGVVFNIILAFTLYFGELTVGSGLQKPIFNSGAMVASAPRINSASVGLLEKGDVILAFNGKLDVDVDDDSMCVRVVTV